MFRNAWAAAKCHDRRTRSMLCCLREYPLQQENHASVQLGPLAGDLFLQEAARTRPANKSRRSAYGQFAYSCRRNDEPCAPGRSPQLVC